MFLISGGEKKLSDHPVRIVESHRELAPDDFLLFQIFFRRQNRIHHRIGQNIQRGRDTILRHVDPKNGAIERCVSVDVTADVLDFLRDRVCRSCPRSFEEHVLENV